MEHARCIFERTILSARCGCDQSTRVLAGERVGVACISDIARNNCRMLLGLLTERSRFALKVTQPATGLPFGKEMKLMLGGLTGLQRLIHPDVLETGVGNIHTLMLEAQQRYGSLVSLPFEEIVRHVTLYEVKRRRP